MAGDLKILDMASAMAKHAASRHQIIAQNIANADTNGYRAKDLEPFAQIVDRAASTLSERGVAAALDGASWRVIADSAPGAASPNGNTVSLEDQMIRSVEAQQAHEAATAIYKKSIEILRLSLGRGV